MLKEAMERLFSTMLIIGNQNVPYHIYFDHEQYTFAPDNKRGEEKRFSFKRENDEWHDVQPVTPDLKKQAIDQLENYLMSQH